MPFESGLLGCARSCELCSCTGAPAAAGAGWHIPCLSARVRTQCSSARLSVSDTPRLLVLAALQLPLESVLLLAASAESESEHPLATAIVSYAAAALGLGGAGQQQQQQQQRDAAEEAADGPSAGAFALIWCGRWPDTRMSPCFSRRAWRWQGTSGAAAYVQASSRWSFGHPSAIGRFTLLQAAAQRRRGGPRVPRLPPAATPR